MPASYPDQRQSGTAATAMQRKVSPGVMLVESVEAGDCDDEIVARWQELAVSAADPNPFYEPWALLPAIEEMASGKIYLTLVWQDSSRKRLDAVYPLCIEQGFRGLPTHRTGLWRHPYCYLCTPLIRSGTAPRVVPQIQQWIHEHAELPSFMSLYWLNGDGHVVREIEAAHAGSTPTGRAGNLHRAAIEIIGDYDDYLKTLRTKKKKEWARHWRRLAETGELNTRIYDVNSSSEDFDAAVTRFLDLENSGWKGREQSSLLSHDSDARWFRTLLQTGQLRDQAMLLEISLDDRAIGMISVITSACGSTAYTLKIASDANYKQYSPGSQTILQLTRHAYEKMSVVIIDSCAAEEHPMINRLWSGRRRITNLHFSNGNSAMKLIVPATDIAGTLAKTVAGTLASVKKEKQ